MFKSMKNAFMDAMKGQSGQSDPRAKFYPIRGWRDDNEFLGEDVELKRDGDNGEYRVMHDGHTMGWVTVHNFGPKDFESADTLQIQSKDGEIVVTFVPEE